MRFYFDLTYNARNNFEHWNDYIEKNYKKWVKNENGHQECHFKKGWEKECLGQGLHKNIALFHNFEYWDHPFFIPKKRKNQKDQWVLYL